MTMRNIEMILIVALLAIVSCASHATAQTPSKSDGASAILRGKVSMGPTMPVQRMGGPPAVAPVAGARVDITNADGVTIASVITGADGSYTAHVAPGSYVVTVTPAVRMLGRNTPRTVTITAGAPNELDIRLDTGIR
jgi:hypothetical protein